MPHRARRAGFLASALLLLGSTVAVAGPPLKLPVTGLEPPNLPPEWSLRVVEGETPTTDVLVRGGGGAELSMELELRKGACTEPLAESAATLGLVPAVEPTYLPVAFAAGALEGPDGLASLGVACAATPRGAMVVWIRYAGAFVDPDAEAAKPVLDALFAAAQAPVVEEKPAPSPGTFELPKSKLKLELAELGATLALAADESADRLVRIKDRGRPLSVRVRRHETTCEAALDADDRGLSRLEPYPPFVPASFHPQAFGRSDDSRRTVLSCVAAADRSAVSWTLRLEYDGPERPGELRRILESAAQSAGHARHPVSFAPYEKRTGTWRSFGAYHSEIVKPHTGWRLELGGFEMSGADRGGLVSLDMLHASFDDNQDLVDGFWGFGGLAGWSPGGTLVADLRGGAGGAMRLGPFDFVLSVGLGSDLVRDAGAFVVNPALYVFYDFRVRIFFQRLVLEGSVLGAGRTVPLVDTDTVPYVVNKETRWGARLVWLRDSGRELSLGVRATVYDASTLGNEPDPLLLDAMLGVTL